MSSRHNKNSKSRRAHQKPAHKHNYTEHGGLDPYEVHEYEKNRLHKGERFGKKWYPENKGE